MRRLLPFLLLSAALTGCSGIEMPSFLGRGGNSDGTYVIGGEDLPLPVSIAPRNAELETALYGYIVRVEGVAPTQGHHSPQLLVANNGRPDANGTLALEFIAIPPASQEAVGPEQTRELRAGYFVPSRMRRTVRGVSVSGGGVSRSFTLPQRETVSE